MRSKLLLVLSAFFYVPSTAQNLPNEGVSSMITPSPNTGYKNFGEQIQVDPFTGRLNAGFTLFSYNSKSSGLTHSIGLNYQGGGILVDQMASDCGLGWSLGIGGTVTREIRGLPDEDGEGGFNVIPDSLPTLGDTAAFGQIMLDLLDGEIDIYSYSAGDASGKFIIGKNGEIVTIPTANVKIEKIYSGYTPTSAPLDSCFNISFRITTENGTKYVYSKFDCSKLEYNENVHFDRYGSSTWYLSKIISPFDQDSIVFNYNAQVQEYLSGYLYTKFNVRGDSTRYFKNQRAYKARVRDWKLSSINYPDGTILTFNYENFKRADFQTDVALHDITITNTFSPSSYSYQFRYYYLNRGVQNKTKPTFPYQNYAGDPDIMNTPTTNKDRNISLVLEKLYMSSGIDQLPGYEFEYNLPTSTTGIPFPQRGSEGAVDRWGFYSSSVGTRFLPTYYDTTNYLGNPGDPDSSDAVTASLSTVKLPTGGKASIEYELHDIPDGMTYKDIYGTTTKIWDTTRLGYYDDDTFQSSYPKIYSRIAASTNKMIIQAVITPTAWPSNIAQNKTISFNIGRRIFTRNFWGPMVVMPYRESFTYQDFQSGTPKVIMLTVDKNDTVTYRIKTTGGTPNTVSQFNVKWEFYNATYSRTDTFHSTKPVGGIRVKRLVSDDNMNQNNKITKEYLYRNSSGASSGAVFNDPVRSYLYTEVYDPISTNIHKSQTYASLAVNPYELVSSYAYGSPQTGNAYRYVVQTSSDLSSSKSVHGSSCTYSSVQEYQGTASNFTKRTIYNFSGSLMTIPSSGSGAFPFPAIPDFDFATGLPISVDVFNRAGLKESSIRYNYSVIPKNLNTGNFRSLKVGIVAHPATDPTHYKYKNYYPITATILPIIKTEIKYYPGGDSLVQKSETTYDPTYSVPKLVKSTNAKNEQIVTRYYYPFDFNISGAITDLKNKKIIYTPIRTETWKDSTLVLNAAINTFLQLSGKVKQEFSYGLTITSPLSKATWGNFSATQLMPVSQHFTKLVSFDSYDALGNLRQTTSRGTINSTVWDYNYRFPVAEVKNARYLDIAYTSFETTSAGAWDLQGGVNYFLGGALTGTRYVTLTNGSKFKMDLGGAVYNLTVWTKNGPPVITTLNTGVSGNFTTTITPTATDAHQGWQLYRATVFGLSVDVKTASTNVAIDELRLYPVGAAMTTSTYDPLFGITSACDASNRTTYFEYDAFGRIKYQRDMDGNIINAYEYKSQEAQN